MMAAVKRALIVGGGPAGLCAATVLRNRGIEAGIVEVEFTDGTNGAYDLVVGADGLRSKVRELVFPDAAEPRFTGQTVWRIMVRRPVDLPDDMAMYYGPRNKAGCNPVSKTHMYVFL